MGSSFFCNFCILVHPTRVQKSTPYTNIGFHWHVFHNVACFLQQSCTAQKINNASIVLYLWFDPILFEHLIKKPTTLRNKTSMTTSRKDSNKSHSIWLIPSFGHLIKNC
uniref:Uncharacterized protein n=1 Tax=Rhizophora mucronata TaxID=61149 RepID=A0A2P2QLF5_RHIMU